MIRKQRGYSIISWIIIIGLAGIVTVMGLRIVPVYMDYGSVKHVMDGLVEDAELRGASPVEIKSVIGKRFQMNNLYDLNDKNAVKLQTLSDGTQVTVHYQVKGPIYGNLEFVATFDYQVVVPKR